MENNEAMKPDQARRLKWHELTIRIEHYKYYLHIALQAAAFFYAITGGVLGFYFKDPAELKNYPLEYFLLLPILMGSVLGGVFIYGARLQEKALDSIENIRDELRDRLGMDVKRLHDAHLLHILLRIFGNIFFVVGISLVLLPFLMRTPRSLTLFWLTAGIILVWGGLLPVAARGIDNRLKQRRKRRRLKKLNSWLEIIRAPNFDILDLERYDFYNELRVYLSRKTGESIKDRTVTKAFLEEDIRKLEKKVRRRDTRTKAEGCWEWFTVA